MSDVCADPLPCPFCGSAEAVVASDRIYPAAPGLSAVTKFVVCCDACGAEVLGMDWCDDDPAAPGFATLPEAVAAWNLRGGRPGGRLDG